MNAQDVTKLTALSPEVISCQATINTDTIGHVALGKSTVLKAVSGVQTVRFKNELERNMTTKLEEPAAEPSEEGEQAAPIESSRICENYHLCESHTSDTLLQSQTYGENVPNSETTQSRKCDQDSQKRESLQSRDNHQPELTLHESIIKQSKYCHVLLTRDLNLEKDAATSSVKLINTKLLLKKPRTLIKTVAARKKCNPQASSQNRTKKCKTSTQDADEYVVDSIVDHSLHANCHLFLVKWRGWSSSHNTWEPFKSLTNCQTALCNFFNSKTKSEDLTKQVNELKSRLGNLKDKKEFIKQFRDENNYFKFPVVDPAKTDSLLRGIVYFSINDSIMMAEVEKQLKLQVIWNQRNKQMGLLKDWESEMNELSINKGLITVENNFDFEGPPKDFIYINDYIPGENVEIPDDPPLGCSCQPVCSKDSKDCCGVMWNRVFAYRALKKLRVGPGMPVYECNKQCQCPADCPNRVVQNGITNKLCIFRTNNNCGWGVKALEPIKRGKFVATYVGEVITFEEAELRGKQYDRNGITYLFDLDFNDKDNALYTVDAGKMGNVTHFINHSCDPNLQVHAVWINCLDPNIPLLAFFASRDIKTGEELSFDYLCQNESIDPPATDHPEHNHVRTLCQCGSQNCRKYLF